MNYARNAFLYSLLAGAFAAFLIIPVNYLEHTLATNPSAASKNGMSFLKIQGTLTLAHNNEPYLLSMNSVDFDSTQKRMLMHELTLKDTLEKQLIVAEKGSLDLATNGITLTKATIRTPQMVTHAEAAQYISERDEWIFEGIVSQGAFDQPHGMQPPP